MSQPHAQRATPEQVSGFIAGLLAFGSWGLVPLYWRVIKHVPATEILAHRMVWSLVFTTLLLCLRRQWGVIRSQTGRQLAISALRGALMGTNWLIFIWAVNAGHVVETSMGYFITPLVNVLFGVFLFRERLASLQIVAVGLAILGVLIAATDLHTGFPWIALGLAASFGLYAALRKMTVISPLPGLFLETASMTPLAAGFLLWKPDATPLLPLFSLTPLFLIGGGIITALPLLWFAQAAQSLRLTTVSFLQYLSPSLTFTLGVFVWHEPFSRARLIAFGCIWAGLAVFSIHALLVSRQKTQPADPAATKLN